MTRLAVLGFLLVGLMGRAAHAQDAKFAFVDMQRAVAETEDGRKARATLKKDFDQKQKELDEQQEALKKAVEDLDKKRTLLPPERVAEKERELQGQLQKVQGTYMRHQQDLAAKEQEALGKIVQRMNRIVEKIAVNENLTMVFDRTQAGLVFARPHLDLTNELIRRYNAGEEAGTAAPAGGAKKPGAPGPAAPKPPAKK